MEYQFAELPRASKIKHAIGAALLLTASVLYLYGTCAPAIRIIGKGPAFLASPTQSHDFSMISLVQLLLHQRNYIPFACTTVFSFVIPTIKFILITVTLVVTTCCRQRTWAVWLPMKVIRVLLVICKYQLVDAFSVILLVTFVNFVGISAEPLLAAQAYLAYCLLSILTTQWLCHCYSETFGRNKKKNCGLFAGSLSNPLLARCTSAYFAQKDGLCHESCTSPVEDSDGSTGLPSRKTPTPSFSITVNENGENDHSCASFVEHQQDIRQRVGRHRVAHCPGNTSPCSADLDMECSEQSNEAEPEQDYNRDSGLPQGSGGHMGVLWNKIYLYRIRVARPFVFAFFVVHWACRAACKLLLRGGRCIRRFSQRASSTVGHGGADVSYWMPGDNSLGSGFSRKHFTECLVRILFLVLLFFISAFSLLVCWVRPILEVALVPGQQRGFAIETSTLSLGDVFSRLYTMGHVLSGCGILFLFPVLCTFVVYASSIGALVVTCLLEWTARRSSADAGSYQLLDDESLIRSTGLSTSRRRFINVSKTLSFIAAVSGDLAMPDVQSIGLLTAYFIVNNVDYFGARLPAVPLGQPIGILERFLWNFSGFWAMLAFGVSASQVHRLAAPEEIQQDLRARLRPLGKARFPRSASGDASGGSEHSHLMGDGVLMPLSLTLSANASSTPGLSELAMMSQPISEGDSDIMRCAPPHDRSRKLRNNLLAPFMHGCIRVALAVLLLLPIWLKPVEVMDIDLGIVNRQLQLFVDYVSPSLKDILPESFGDCLAFDHQAPTPCTGSQPLAVVRTATYEANARWVTGLKTTHLQIVRFDPAPDNRIVLTVAGMIDTLSLSLRVGECLYGEAPGACPVLWDGTDSCCGNNISFALQMDVECRSSPPYLSDARPLPTHISQLVVSEKILGIFPVEVADITEIAEGRVTEWVQTYLDPQNKWVHWTNGETMSLIDFLNLLLRMNAPAGLRCPKVA